jgi:hypothetical protein
MLHHRQAARHEAARRSGPADDPILVSKITSPGVPDWEFIRIAAWGPRPSGREETPLYLPGNVSAVR